MALAIVGTEHSADELRDAARRTKDTWQARRLLAIALVLDGASRTEAARAAGMERQTPRDWVIRYNEEGIEELHDRPRPGRPPRLLPEQMAELAQRVEDGPDLAEHGVVRWRCADLAVEIRARFGVVLAERAIAAALVLPFANREAMNLHPREISQCVSEGAHALLVVDGAGWHTSAKLEVPDNITLPILPPYAPELNPVENIWQYLRQNKLAIRLFQTYEDIVEACCEAWLDFIAEPGRIAAITKREWAIVS